MLLMRHGPVVLICRTRKSAQAAGWRVTNGSAFPDAACHLGPTLGRASLCGSNWGYEVIRARRDAHILGITPQAARTFVSPCCMCIAMETVASVKVCQASGAWKFDRP